MQSLFTYGGEAQVFLGQLKLYIPSLDRVFKYFIPPLMGLS